MIRRLLCWLGGHQLCHYELTTSWWWCRCGARGESAHSRLFGDEVQKA